MANKIKGFRVGMKVEGTLNSAGGEKVEGKVLKVNSKGKAVVEVEGRGKCIIPLHSLKALGVKDKAKQPAAKKKEEAPKKEAAPKKKAQAEKAPAEKGKTTKAASKKKK